MNIIDRMLTEKTPKGVKYYKLSEIGTNYNGLSGKTKDDFEDGNARYITYKNIFNNPSVLLDSDDYVKITEEEKQNYIKYKDILITGSSENLEDSCMISVVTEHPTEKIYLNSFCFGFRLNEDFYEKFDADFLKHLFRDSKFRNSVLGCSFGVTRYNLSKERLFKIKIPCPPIEVQIEIAKILDELEENKKRLEEQLKQELELREQQFQFYRYKLMSFEED